MKYILSAILLFATVITFAEEKSLQSVIDAAKAKNRAKADPEKLAAYAAGIEAVRKAEITKSAKQEGEKAPEFTLPDAKGGTVNLSSELKKGPVVLAWYRGGWCPYCNIQLAAYQQILPQIEELGAQLIAVSPELPDNALSTAEKNDLKFPVLSDQNLKVAAEYGLVFKLTPDVEKYYAEFFDMAEYNGDDAAKNELPLAATYVIGQNGKIAWAFLESDYTKRAEPGDILRVLNELQKP